MTPFDRFMESPSSTSKNGEIILFTMAVMSVGFVSYLYLRANAALQQVNSERQTFTDSLTELNENINNVYLRLEDMPSREDVDEKMNLNTENEIDHHHHQSWRGTYEEEITQSNIIMEIVLAKLKTYRSNNEWVEEKYTPKDPSITVRDYYIQTFDSDYRWKITRGDSTTAYLYETMVNDWRSVIHVKILINTRNTDSTLNNEYFTEMFKRCQNPDMYTWRRTLVDV